ncbi:MAG: carcinine hydrolase/isopenicillin-N N-acyltransferase family protein [Bacteroidota bacterium]
MKIKLLILSFFLLQAFIFDTQPTSACTIFQVNGPNLNYFAANEDWTFVDPVIRIVPGNKGDYSYLVFGWSSYLPSYPQAGVNEHGICLDWASVSSQRFKEDSNRKQLDEDIIYKILKKCRNIEEVIGLIRSYNCSQFAGEHLLVADRNGDSCVIEWSGNDYVFLRKTDNYQVITNFCLSNPKIGWYSCERFNTVGQYLNKIKDIDPDFKSVRGLLERTHQERDYPTIYSYIVDQNNLDLYVFYNHDYSKYTKFNFRDEIKKGPHQIKLYQ